MDMQQTPGDGSPFQASVVPGLPLATHLNSVDRWFVDACNRLWQFGEHRPGRNGITRSKFVYHFEHDMSLGFPILGVKKQNFGASVGEMLAFMAGADNARHFRELGCNFWDANAKAEYWTKNPNHNGCEGDLGRIYGVQWRSWVGTDSCDGLRGVDQLQTLIQNLRKDPMGRRHLVTAWQPAELDQMALPPCHTGFQVYCHVDGRLSLHMDQRSADVFLGVPYNISGYAFLLHILALMTGRRVGNLTIRFGDFHWYDVHETEDQALTKLNKAAVEHRYPLPTFLCDTALSINWQEQDFSPRSMAVWADPKKFKLAGYQHGPFIPARMIE